MVGALAQAVRPLTRDPGRAAVLCDIDGTLAPIVERPEDARVPDDVARLLGELGRRYACVACVSGRSAADARRLVGEASIGYAGLHGAEVLAPGEERARLVPAVAEWEGRVRGFAAERDTESLRRLGIRIEDKGPIAAFHWRGVTDEDAALLHLQGVAREAESERLETHWGRKVLEVRPPVRIDKGLAVRELVLASGSRAALYGGDDTTDLDAFVALDALVAAGPLDGAVRVGVRSDEGPPAIVERADLVVDGVDGFARVLRYLGDA
jgi:trehalose 6-phosphate phosphatase